MQGPVPQCLEWDFAQLRSSQTLWCLGCMSRCFLGNRESTLCIFISVESPELLWHRILQSYLQIYLNYSINRQNSLKFLDFCSQHRCLFRRSHPSRLSLMFQAQLEPGLSPWLALWFGLGRGMFFLRAPEFPKAAARVCLFPQHFKACPVPWLLGFWAALVSDRSEEENPPEPRVLQPPAEEWPTHSGSQCQTTSAEMLKFVPSWHCSGKANFVGEALSVKTSEQSDFYQKWQQNESKSRMLQKFCLSAASFHFHQHQSEIFLRISPGDSLWKSFSLLLQILLFQKGNECFWVNYWQSKSVTALRSFQCMRLHSSSQSWWK